MAAIVLTAVKVTPLALLIKTPPVPEKELGNSGPVV